VHVGNVEHDAVLGRDLWVCASVPRSVLGVLAVSFRDRDEHQLRGVVGVVDGIVR
jgi:hypothetical protein